jgi:ABC-2 type transport system ATP-binding protein
MSKAAAEARLKTLLPSLDLADFEKRALSEMSGGQRRRFDIALGLMHEPKLIFLDEPTTGLDPQSRANLWDHIRKLRTDHGTTVLITTHYLDEADALADRLLVMDHGKLVANDTADSLKSRISGDLITITVKGAPEAALAVAQKAIDVRASSIDKDRLLLTVARGDEAVAPVVIALQAAGISVGSITSARPSLDDVFLTLTGRTLREDGAAG